MLADVKMLAEVTCPGVERLAVKRVSVTSAFPTTWRLAVGSVVLIPMDVKVSREPSPAKEFVTNISVTETLVGKRAFGSVPDVSADALSSVRDAPLAVMDVARMLPMTCNLSEGVRVPTPTLPVVVIPVVLMRPISTLLL